MPPLKAQPGAASAALQPRRALRQFCDDEPLIIRAYASDPRAAREQPVQGELVVRILHDHPVARIQQHTPPMVRAC